MTHAFHRFSAALTNWIPDLSGIPARRRMTLGIVTSVLLHLLAILVIALLIGDQKQRVDFAKPKLRARNIELTIEPPEPEPFVPFTLEPKPEQPIIDSRGLDIAREAALNPIFQADENMRAASELPASGDAPLPSQAGRDRPFNAFQTQKSLLGSSVPQPFPPSEPVPPLIAPPVAPAPPAVAQQTPPPSPPEPAEKTEKTEPAPPKPEAQKEPMKIVEKPREEEIALTPKPVATPAPVATPPPFKATATPHPAEQHAKLTTPVPKLRTARESGYQPEQEMNRIEGSISNRGKKSVDAVATPLAKYRKQVNDAIGSRWYYYVKDPQRMSLIAPGSAKISFYIDAQGQVVGIRLESNSSNASFGELCTSAVRDAREQIKELKLPVDATIPLKDGRLECSLTFTFYTL